MGLRFRKSFRLLPGIKLNLSKSGPSLSVGGPGASVNIGSKKTRASVGLPGSGLSYATSRSYGVTRGGKVFWIVLAIVLLVIAYQAGRGSFFG